MSSRSDRNETDFSATNSPKRVMVNPFSTGKSNEEREVLVKVDKYSSSGTTGCWKKGKRVADPSSRGSGQAYEPMREGSERSQSKSDKCGGSCPGPKKTSDVRINQHGNEAGIKADQPDTPIFVQNEPEQCAYSNYSYWSTPIYKHNYATTKQFETRNARISACYHCENRLKDINCYNSERKKTATSIGSSLNKPRHELSLPSVDYPLEYRRRIGNYITSYSLESDKYVNNGACLSSACAQLKSFRRTRTKPTGLLVKNSVQQQPRSLDSYNVLPRSLGLFGGYMEAWYEPDNFEGDNIPLERPSEDYKSDPGSRGPINEEKCPGKYTGETSNLKSDEELRLEKNLKEDVKSFPTEESLSSAARRKPPSNETLQTTKMKQTPTLFRSYEILNRGTASPALESKVRGILLEASDKVIQKALISETLQTTKMKQTPTLFRSYEILNRGTASPALESKVRGVLLEASDKEIQKERSLISSIRKTREFGSRGCLDESVTAPSFHVSDTPSRSGVLDETASVESEKSVKESTNLVNLRATACQTDCDQLQNVLRTTQKKQKTTDHNAGFELLDDSEVASSTSDWDALTQCIKQCQEEVNLIMSTRSGQSNIHQE